MMDTRTGELLFDDEVQRRVINLQRAFEDFVPVEEKEMTPKQKATNKVSLHDHRSKLGKKLTSARYQRNYFFKRNPPKTQEG